MSNDTRAQLKFLEKLDQMEKQRRDEEEREMLLRAAKVRVKGFSSHQRFMAAKQSKTLLLKK